MAALVAPSARALNKFAPSSFNAAVILRAIKSANVLYGRYNKRLLSQNHDLQELEILCA